MSQPCEECGVSVAHRFHDGRWLCAAHKILTATPPPMQPAAVDVMAAVDAVAARFASFAGQHSEAAKDAESRLLLAIDRHRSETTNRHAQVDNHERRIAATEVALGSARDILGDVSMRGDVAAQIGMLTQAIAGLRAQHAESEAGWRAKTLKLASATANDRLAFDRHAKMTIWQRLLWFVLGNS